MNKEELGYYAIWLEDDMDKYIDGSIRFNTKEERDSFIRGWYEASDKYSGGIPIYAGDDLLDTLERKLYENEHEKEFIESMLLHIDIHQTKSDNYYYG